MRGGGFIFLPSIAVVCSCQDGAARIAFQPRSCRAGWLNPPSGAPPLAGIDPEDRLDSWKEIAAYLERDVTTVQR